MEDGATGWGKFGDAPLVGMDFELDCLGVLILVYSLWFFSFFFSFFFFFFSFLFFSFFFFASHIFCYFVMDSDFVSFWWRMFLLCQMLDAVFQVQVQSESIETGNKSMYIIYTGQAWSCISASGCIGAEKFANSDAPCKSSERSLPHCRLSLHYY